MDNIRSWWAPLTTTFLTLFSLLRQVQCLQYVTNSSLPTVNMTAGCANALMANISCDPWIASFRPGQYYDPVGLQEVCTSDCAGALQLYQQTVADACTGQLYNYTDTIYYPLSAIPGQLGYFFNRTCVQDGVRFCNFFAYEASLQNDPNANPVLGDVTGPTAANTTSTTGNGTVLFSNSTDGVVDFCDDCFIKILQIDASSPLGGGSDLAPIFSSLTSSCSKTGFPLSTSTIFSSSLVSNSTATPTPTCSGQTYTVAPGDSCRSISISQGIGTGWLLIDNDLPAYCSQFPTNGTLCIQNTCAIYTVRQNDTCTSIAKSFNVTQSQIISWNPILNPSCNNLKLSVNDSICVGKPGIPYSIPTTSLPAATSFSTAAPLPTNIANGTNHNCGLYYEAVPGDYCNLICLRFGITLDDFVFMNPAINSNCTNFFAMESYCVAPVGSFDEYPGHSGFVPTSTFSAVPWSSFPIATFVPPRLNITADLPIANGTRLDCYLIVDGSNLQSDITGTFYSSVCEAISLAYGITLDHLQNWNPSLLSNSTSCSFDSSVRYCMSAYNSTDIPVAPSDTQLVFPMRDGTWTNCTDYGIAIGADTCSDILSWYNLTIAQFYTWNPEVGPDCSTLVLGYSYCVSITNQTLDFTNSTISNNVTATPVSPSGTASATASITTATPPGPTQAGQPENCINWYIAQSGDSCFSIEDAFNLADELFHQWNPAVSADCSSGLWAGEAYCVGTSDNTPTRSSQPSPPSSTSSSAIPSPTQPNSIISNCNSYALANNGDTCSQFAQDNGVSTSDLYSWNAVLGSDGLGCSNSFWAGYYYCVGVAT